MKFFQDGDASRVELSLKLFDLIETRRIYLLCKSHLLQNGKCDELSSAYSNFGRTPTNFTEIEHSPTGFQEVSDIVFNSKVERCLD